MVEGGGLENRFTGNRDQGSNPCSSASTPRGAARGILDRLQTWARAIRRDVVALYLALRDPRVPWTIKVLAGLIVAYALSPIDLIPDFIPLLGHLDDVILLPLAILGVVHLIDKELMAELREAATKLTERPVSRWGAVLVATTWLAIVALILWLI